jgi:hypothetical protein
MNSPEEKQHERLAQALREASQKKPIFVPPTLDEAILKQARAHFEPKKKEPRPIWLRWLEPAFAVIVVCGIFLFFQPPKKFAREDLNRDGRVDILDALTLAKAIQANTGREEFDQNGDRKLNEADVLAAAQAAVRLDRKPGS